MLSDATNIWTICLVTSLPLVAGADQGEPAAYAIVIGSSQGGASQGPLQYAGLDAERVANVLVDLSHYRTENVASVINPTRAELLHALDDIEARLQDHEERGEKSRLFFYYSGHARSNALNLGEELVPLEELRNRLVGMPATLTVAVLDACQSGSFSRVKGTEPAADFSYNSVSRLNAEGLVVLASSSGSELSQESEDLNSSFFTHHLLVALRGAGDMDQDGRVSLGEAYRYAYNRTLVTTAKTAVGGQHVTLETSLKGKGELVLSYPAEADAHLNLEAELAGTIIVSVQPKGTVLAELHKAAGLPMQLALPRGEYVAIVRSSGEIRKCALNLVETNSVTLDFGKCEATRVSSRAKGDLPAVGQAWEKAVVYSEESRSPAAAAWLAAIPIPGGFGHAYNNQYWSQGAFFTALEATEIVTFFALWAEWTRYSDSVREDLADHYDVVLTTADQIMPKEPERTGVLLGIGLVFVATKVWEALDAYHHVKAYNEDLRSRLRVLPIESVRLTPSVQKDGEHTRIGGVATLSF